jgi:DNA repair exonuclease SbcCD ATPase subunit
MLEKVYQLDLSEQISSLQAEVKSMQEEIREIDKQVFHLENSKKQLQRFTVDCDWNQEEQDKKIQEQESLTKKLGDLEKIESLVMLIEKNRKRIAQLTEEIGLSTIDRQNFEIERKTGLYALRKEGEILQNSILELNDTIKDLQRDKDTLLKDKSWFEKGVCPTCNAPIQDAEKKVVELEEKVSGIDHFLEKHSRENLSLQQKLSEIKAKVSDITKSQATLKREIAKEREERNQLEAWKKELGIAMQQATDLAKSCPEPDMAITEVQDKLEVLKKDIQRFRDQETRRFAIEKQNDEARKLNEESKIKLAEFSDKKESLLESISVATQSQMILTRDFPSWILMKESKSVEAEMNRFLDEVYEGRYHVSIDVAKAGIGIFYNDGSDVSLASGSEKDLMNLAFKMALSRLSGMKILFLDEVDKFCDVKVAGKLFDVVIEQVNKGKLDQVFIVTHSVDMQNKLELREEVQVIEV